MIVVKLIGGLGNQMFQYAMARSLADRHNTTLKLDISDFEHYTLRRYELGDLNVRAEIADQGDLGLFWVSAKRRRFWQRVKSRILPYSRNMVFREQSFTYDERLNNIKPPLYLEGYWQSERYFFHNSSTIRKDFTLRVPFNKANKEMREHIESINAVSLHVRRGDYVSDPRTNNYHGACSLEYYRSAIGHMACRLEKPHFIIFSDDHEWVRKNFTLDYPATFVTTNSKDQGVLDMMLMLGCKHHIIANSSFSWWGAWLNSSVDKIVIAPKQWFNDAPHDVSDLIPETWVKL